MVFQQPQRGLAWSGGYPMWAPHQESKALAGPLPQDTPAGESAALLGVYSQRKAPGASHGHACLHARCLLLRAPTQDGQ